MSKIFLIFVTHHITQSTMNELTQKIRELLTKYKLKADSLHNEFDLYDLIFISREGNIILTCIQEELNIIQTFTTKMVAMNDISTLETNLETITASIRFKKMGIETFCMN